MAQTKSELLKKRWGVGWEVKTERNALFSCSVCLVCGNYPNHGGCRMLSLCLVSSVHSKATPVCSCVRSSVCACAVLSATFNLHWYFQLVCIQHLCVCVWALTDSSLLLSLIKNQRHNVVKLWERIQVGMEERKSGTDRSRARGRRRSTRWSEALSHQLALWPRVSLSLYPSLSFLLLFTPSIFSQSLSQALSLHNLSPSGRSHHILWGHPTKEKGR